MKVHSVPVLSKEEVAEKTFVLKFESSDLARLTRPGQFLNIRVDDSLSPLLRRPFSVARVEGSAVELIFNIVGRGTRILAEKRIGDELDVLGPLGIPFRVEGDFETAVIVAGGVGVAPFPILTDWLTKAEKNVETFLGARSAAHLVFHHLKNVHSATDDGSRGFHGTVVQLLDQYLNEHPIRKPKIFACGPTAMLKAVSVFAKRKEIRCELSLEGEMGCGIGICQGCPVERTSGEKKYALVCTDGPTFDSSDIALS